MDRVFEEAKRIVSRPPSEWGYGDVGDVLVSYLRGSMTEETALEQLGFLEEDYSRAPK